jgi:TRAP-type C4-dicarboxylate transport system permease small subunit
MSSFERGVDFLVTALRIIGAACLAGMMMLTCADVLLRAFGRPIFGTVDIVKFLAVIVLACAMPYTHQQHGHVGVDLFVQKLGPRGQAIVDSITSLVSGILFGLVTWQMWLYAKELGLKGEVSMAIEIPVYPFIYFVAVCFAVLTAAIFIDLTRLVGKAVKG